jgi:tripartite ATP-independent transporter DctP family solute receptor
MRIDISRRGLTAAALSSFAVWPFSASRFACASSLRRTIRIGTVNPAVAATANACRAFAAAVAASPILSQMMEVETFTDGVLGGELEMAKACIAGDLDLAVIASNIIANIVPQVGLLDAPFLFRDAQHGRAVLDGAIGVELTDLMRANSVNNLAWAENGLRHITSNKPIREPKDLRNLHIRVPQSDVMVEVFKTLGANPEQLPFPQLYEALSAGRFEAEENPVATIVAANFARVQRYLNLTGHVYSAAFFIVSSDLLEDLAPAHRVALAEAARFGAEASRATASNGERDGIAVLRRSGMTIVQDVDRSSLAAAARPALDDIANRLGPERAAQIRAFPA